RGLVVAGAGSGDPTAVHAMAGALGWPVLADPRSGARLPRHGTVAAADALLRCPGFASSHRPEVVVRLGEPWASGALSGWLGSLGEGVQQLVVDPWWAWSDPQRTASTVVRAGPTELCRAVAARTGPGGAGGARVGSGEGGWLDRWTRAESVAQQAIDAVLGRRSDVTEPGVARTLLSALPPGATLVLASSMPVRDVEWYGRPERSPPRVLSNRGANGIDGTVSTALGVAAGTGGSPTVALLGDLAFLHDAGALLGAAEAGLAVTLVVVDNGGGGIFSFLPQAEVLEGGQFERLFGTPQDVDLARVAEAYGAGVTEVDGMPSLRPALARAMEAGGCLLLRVRTERKANVAVHAELHAAVAEAVTAAGLLTRAWP
ncbi:MAG: thiamine pyrophosphate-dependent enzyme, partial [Acidimicrobiales bacterium]